MTLGNASEVEPASLPQRTAAVLERLRRHRAVRARNHLGDLAYRVYVVLLVGALTVAGLVTTAREAVETISTIPLPWAQALADVLPFALPGMCLLVLWVGSYDATIRGPVRVDPATVDWVLTLPIDRAAVLVPALWRSIATRAALGAVAGMVTVIGLWQTTLPLPLNLAVALAWAGLGGALLGALTATLGTLATAWGERALRAWRPIYYAALFMLGVSGPLAWGESVPPATGVLALWSGPWGWAAQVMMGPVRLPGAWPEAAALLLAGLVAATAVVAMRLLPCLPLPLLSAHAAAASGVRSGFWLIDASWLDTTFGGSHRARPRRSRLPRHGAPGSPWPGATRSTWRAPPSPPRAPDCWRCSPSHCPGFCPMSATPSRWCCPWRFPLCSTSPPPNCWAAPAARPSNRAWRATSPTHRVSWGCSTGWCRCSCWTCWSAVSPPPCS
ncbi:hypothetical protein [Salinactinospora qingdaonensis]|uniref:hypothetical protein n=1 Tax=Salinactinospora qingdaonensis TaxID=702744 RepID=UPI0031E9FE92